MLSSDTPVPQTETIRSITPDRVRSKSLRSLLAYWESKERQLGRLPERNDLQPDEMLPFLPFVSLIEVRRNPLSFRFRLVGTGIVGAMGREATNRLVDDDMFGTSTEAVEAFFSIPLDTHGPAYASGEYTVTPSGRQLGFESLLVPLSGNGQVIDMLLGGLVGQRLAAGEQICSFHYNFYCPLMQTAAG